MPSRRELEKWPWAYKRNPLKDKPPGTDKAKASYRWSNLRTKTHAKNTVVYKKGGDMKFASFDLEVADDVGENWKDNPPGISCAAVVLSGDPTIHQFVASDTRMTTQEAQDLLRALIEFQLDGYTVTTWNGAQFDLPVLALAANRIEEAARLALEHIDMMMWVTFTKGWYLSLEAALAGMQLSGKLKRVVLSDGTILEGMSGAKAPQLWRDGEREAVLSYLEDDVRQPLALIEKAVEMKTLKWRSKSGKMHMIPVTDPPKNVVECFDIPEPDVSWMDKPPTRTQFVDWMPEDVLKDYGLLEVEDAVQG